MQMLQQMKIRSVSLQNTQCPSVMLDPAFVSHRPALHPVHQLSLAGGIPTRRSTVLSGAFPRLKLFEAVTAREGDKPRPGKQSGRSARQVVEEFYAAYNAGDLEAIGELMDENVEYHDMVYPEPFRGRAAVVEFMRKVRATVPSDLKFAVDSITDGEGATKVGVMWHADLGGIAFPFSRGCSFYTVKDGRIVQARDVVEGAVKPGSGALSIITLLAPLICKLGPAADPSNLSKLPLAAAAVWAFYAGYTAYIMFSTSAPGLPAWQTPPEVLKEVFDESLNFFYVNIAIDSLLGWSPVPNNPQHPVSEAVFNFVSAWGLLFLPIILTEQKSQKVGNKYAWWTGIMFLTNVFFIPFLALRAAPEPDAGDDAAPSSRPTPSSSLSAAAAVAEQPPQYAGWMRAAAAVALGVGVFSLGWAAWGRPEYGDLGDRLAYFNEAFSSNRVFYAFIVDAGLYAVWQAAMLSTVPGVTPAQRFVPFFGLAAHVLGLGAGESTDEGSSSSV